MPTDLIRDLIAKTEDWKRQHKSAGRSIEVWACNIRLVALRQCLKIAEE